MGPKSYLKKSLNKELRSLKNETKELEGALCALERVDFLYANYLVHIKSGWADSGEKSIKKKFKGSLEDAIKEAEKTFRLKNDGKEIQADYFVKIKLGKTYYSLPNTYVERYIKR
ncbi:MAG: hypothetical protein AABW57_00760 [Nanoarchaeota archaeon]